MDQAFLRQNWMVNIPGGIERVRKFRDYQKWISSDSRLSVPSNGLNQAIIVTTIEILPFQIARYPVTNGIYDFFAEIPAQNTTDFSLPRVNVSWLDAIHFCNRLSRVAGFTECYRMETDSTNIGFRRDADGYRLPTAAEWQYACHAGNDAYQYSPIDDIAWHAGNSGARPHPVGSKKPNAWGLYDMLGNIWEWVWDLFDITTHGPYRVFRGGSYAEPARICGATTRRKSFPDFAIDDLGFRLARNAG